MGQACLPGEVIVGFDDEGALVCRMPPRFTVTTVDDSAGDEGHNTSIAIGADGLPVVSYRFGSAELLRVAHCGNVTCTAGNTLTTVDRKSHITGHTSIAIGADGLPVVSYNTASGVVNEVKRLSPPSPRLCWRRPASMRC